ncbi:type IV secretion system protein VirB10 [Neisseria meningitidis]|nr:type IV secretion system protein VirB10 [Neisseria meningitidis]
MFDAYKNRQKKQDSNEESQELNSIGVNFNNNENEEVNNEGESHNVADTRSSSSAQKGFFVICCLGMVVLLGFMFFKSKVKSDTQEDVREAAEVSKKSDLPLPNFELPPDKVASEPAEASAPAVVLDDTPAAEPAPALEATPLETQQMVEQPAAPTPHEIRLRSALMVSDNERGEKGGLQNVSGSSNDDASAQPAALSDNDMGGGNGGGGSSNALAGSLNPTATPSATANRFANRNLLLAKGTVIQCSLKTRIETQVAGMVACTTLRDVYSDNKKVLLIERGSTIEGEYQNAAEMGATRIFVLWTRVRTPKGIVVNLNSPATDTLGGAGLGGYVNHHFWRRFGNAMMFSLIQDGVATGFKRLERSKTAQTIFYGNSEDTTDDIVQEIIKSTANIPPTIYKNQGDNAAVYVARDIDFSKVYSLKPIAAYEVNQYNGGILQ